MEWLHTFLNYINHWLLAVDEHSLHSPFLYNVYIQAIKPAKSTIPDFRIEKLHNHYRDDQRVVQGEIFGTGGRRKGKKVYRIKDIAIGGLTLPKYSLLMLTLINYFKCKHVLELGTSLGLNALYLAKGKYVKKLFTFEGNRMLAGMARNHFEQISEIPIELVPGNIDQTLGDHLKKNPPVDFVYLDANHTLEASIRYVDMLIPHLTRPSILVIDDIYWSTEMTIAWKQIISNPVRKLCLDLFQVGILIFHEEGPEGYFHLVY